MATQFESGLWAYHPKFLEKAEADALFRTVLEETTFAETYIRARGGRQMKLARKTASFSGDQIPSSIRAVMIGLKQIQTKRLFRGQDSRSRSRDSTVFPPKPMPVAPIEPF